MISKIGRISKVCVSLFAASVLLAGTAAAQTPDFETPADEVTCSLFGGTANGLCVAYCEAQDCDAFNTNSSSCQSLRTEWTEITGEINFPCDITDPNSIIPTFGVAVVADRTYGTIDTIFNLESKTIFSDFEAVDWQWRFSDGRTFVGEQITISFVSTGFYSGTLTVINSAGQVAEATTGLIIYSENQQALDLLRLPNRMGDVNDDGLVSLIDAHLAAKHSGRLESLVNLDPRHAADIDFEDGVTSFDTRLIGQAVANDEILPNALLTKSAFPGGMATIVSPDLLDPNTLIEINVGNSTNIIRPARPILGYVTFAIPFDPTTPGSAVVVPGPVIVELIIDGVVAEEYSIEIKAPEPLPADPELELRAFFQELVTLFERNELILANQLDQLPLTSKERSTLLASASAGRISALAAIENYERLLDTTQGMNSAAFLYIAANAQGLSELRQRLQTFNSLGENPTEEEILDAAAAINPDEVCDELLPAICLVKASSDLLSDAGDFASGWCDLLLAIGLGLIIVPADAGPAGEAALLTIWASVCAPLEVAIDTASVLTSLISDLDADLALEAEPTNPSAGEVVTITASLDVFGLDDVCQLAGSKGAGVIEDKLAEQIVGRLIRRKFLMRAMTKIFTKFGEDVLQDFFDLLKSAAKSAINNSQLANALLALSQPYCEDIFGVKLIMNASRVLSGPEPMQGNLTFLSDGTAQYTCDAMPAPGDEDTVAFTAEKQICDAMQTKMVEVECGTRPVTITIGDNGSLNDDIFEVRIDGQTVLTSSTPVRSISTTVNLPLGEQEVQMIGRAAPDGIGTYFISFSGATVVGGDSTSGTDLTPGVTKTFIILVQ